MNNTTYQKIFLIVLVSMVILLVLGFVGFFLFQPRPDEAFGKIPEPKIESVLNENIKITENSTRISSKPRQATLINVYEKAQVVDEESLVTGLGFSASPRQIGEELYWSQTNKSLRLKYPSTRFTYLSNPRSDSENVSRLEAEEIALAMMASLGLANETDLPTVRETRRLLIKVEGGEVEEGQDFNNYSFVLGLDLDNFDVISQTGNADLENIWVGKDGTVTKIDGDRRPLIKNAKSSYALKPFGQAEKEIREGKGVVVEVDGALKSKQISISYKKYKIAYLLTGEDEKYFYPVYVFEGSVSSLNSLGVKVTALLPALRQ